MKPSYALFIAVFVASLIGGLVWSASYYQGKYQTEKARADTAEQRADSSEVITSNVLRIVAITNFIQEANQYAKQEIEQGARNVASDIKAAMARDDCAVRPVPAGAAERLRVYANSLRTGTSGSAPSQSAR